MTAGRAFRMFGRLRQGRRAARADGHRCERMSESANPGDGSGRGESAPLFADVAFFCGARRPENGVLGAYAERIHGEAKRRPLRFAKERTGFPPPASRAGL